VQTATAQSKTGIFCGYDVDEATPVLHVGWSDSMYFFSFFLSYVLYADGAN
jgi:hypothetical protein